jgi:hypothetical protein
MLVWSTLFSIAIIYIIITSSIKDRYFSIFQFILVPPLLTMAIFFIITHLFSFSIHLLAIAFTGMLIGILMGIAFYKHTPLKVIKSKHKILLPGNYKNIIPLFIVLGVNYLCTYLKLFNPEFFHDNSSQAQQVFLLAYSTSMSLWIGINLLLSYRYFTEN